MTQEQKIKNIETLLPILKEFRATGTAKMPFETKLMMKATYQQINPGTNVDIACTTCIIFTLTMMEAWYEREKPLFLALQAVTPPAIAESQQEHREEAEPAIETLKPKIKRTSTPRKKK